MPDPADPTPVRVKRRGRVYFIVDKNGRRLPGQDAFKSEQAAQSAADAINATWDRAKAERKSKGAPEITEAIGPDFERLHPRRRKGAPGGGQWIKRSWGAFFNFGRGQSVLVDGQPHVVADSAVYEGEPLGPSYATRDLGIAVRRADGKGSPRVVSVSRLSTPGGKANPVAGDEKIGAAVAAAKTQGVDVQDAFAPHNLNPSNPGSADRVEARMQAAAAILGSGTEIPDAALLLPDETARREKIVATLTQGDVERAQTEYRYTPVGDLEILGNIRVDSTPVFGQAHAKLGPRRVHMGSTSAMGDFRHELGHVLQGTMGGKGGIGTHTPLTKVIADEYEKAKQRRDANIKAGKPKPQSEAEWEEKLQIIDPRSLDTWQEFFAEHYRAYHRSIYRATHPEASDYDADALKKYRENHPGMTRLFDAWYTAQLAGRAAQPSAPVALPKAANPATGMRLPVRVEPAKGSTWVYTHTDGREFALRVRSVQVSGMHEVVEDPTADEVIFEWVGPAAWSQGSTAPPRFTRGHFARLMELGRLRQTGGDRPDFLQAIPIPGGQGKRLFGPSKRRARR